MPDQDWIGHRGENLFRVMITKICDNKMWFHEVMLGEKYPTVDFHLDLLPSVIAKSYCFIQVKATAHGYTGTGDAEKLNVQVTREDLERLKGIPAPTYVVGIDVMGEKGFLFPIKKDSPPSINGIPTKYPIDCTTIKQLWQEVNGNWKAKKMLSSKSIFKF